MTEILTRIASAVLEGSREETLKQIETGLAEGCDPLEMINGGLSAGLKAVGEKFECGEYYLPDMMLAAGAMNAALDLLEPHLQRNEKSRQDKPVRVVIGTVKGDLHSIGKDIVIMMLKAAGMEVFDLGVDVPALSFIEALQEKRAEILGISALMTTTIREQKNVIDFLVEKGLRERVKIIVGGAPLSAEWAAKIGADAYAADAIAAVRIINNLLGRA